MIHSFHSSHQNFHWKIFSSAVSSTLSFSKKNLFGIWKKTRFSVMALIIFYIIQTEYRCEAHQAGTKGVKGKDRHANLSRSHQCIGHRWRGSSSRRTHRCCRECPPSPQRDLHRNSCTPHTRRFLTPTASRTTKEKHICGPHKYQQQRFLIL